MKILLTGSGGRESALAWKISRSPLVDRLFIAPGNAGMTAFGECVNIPAGDLPALLKFAKNNAVDLTVVGPEDPLAAGIVDLFQENNLAIFGPTQRAAQIEASKNFAKELMRKHNIPTADFRVFQSADEAKNFLRGGIYPKVIKADGLAAGKGVTVCANAQEALEAVDATLTQKKFGAAGRKIIVEEFMEGQEASLFALTDGKTILPMVAAQDHKRLNDGDTGPNTGGMGAYCPAPVITSEIYNRVQTRILVPMIHAMNRAERPFQGLLYAGLMIAHGEPKIIEFNCRFGDPETQVVIPKLTSDLVPLLHGAALGTLAEQADQVTWDDRAVLSVALCSGGYPGDYKKGAEINGLEEAARLKDVMIFHAGTALRDGKFITNGGRVLNVTAAGSNLREARDLAYLAVSKISFSGMHYRKDIGAKAL